jgi:hypothetical protein
MELTSLNIYDLVKRKRPVLNAKQRNDSTAVKTPGQPVENRMITLSLKLKKSEKSR